MSEEKNLTGAGNCAFPTKSLKSEKLEENL